MPPNAAEPSKIFLCDSQANLRRPWRGLGFRMTKMVSPRSSICKHGYLKINTLRCSSCVMNSFSLRRNKDLKPSKISKYDRYNDIWVWRGKKRKKKKTKIASPITLVLNTLAKKKMSGGIFSYIPVLFYFCVCIPCGPFNQYRPKAQNSQRFLSTVSFDKGWLVTDADLAAIKGHWQERRETLLYCITLEHFLDIFFKWS